MPFFKYFKFLLVIILSSSMLVACGGGGGSSDTTDTNTTTSDTSGSGTSGSGTSGNTTTTASKPTVNTLTKSIPENTTAVDTLVADGNGSPITSFSITGGDAALFSISNAGVITAKNAFDFEATPTKTQFTFQATATNAIGDSDPVTVTVNITDVADDRPTVADSTFKLLESAKPDTIVGQLTITQGDAVVSAATLTGTGADNFTIATDGTISVTSGTPSLGQDFTLTATITNQYGDSTATVTIDTFNANFAGATPKLMPLGDSITSGQGGELTVTLAADITTNLEAALTAINAAADSIKSDDSIDFTNTLTDAQTAQTALTAVQTAVANYIATVGTVDASYTIPELANAITAIDNAVKAIDLADDLIAPISPSNATFSGARSKTLTAKDKIRNATRNAYGSIQRLTYRKPLLEKRDNSTNVNFDVIGRNIGPRQTNGTSLFANNKHEGYSGSFADTTKTGFGILNEQLTASLAGDANNIATAAPDIVLLHIGTNDIAFGNDTEGNAAAVAGVKTVIETLRASNPEVVILLAQIIPLIEGNLEYRGGVAVDAYNTALATLVNDDKHPTSTLTLIDHSTPFAAGASLYVGDGVHPNAAGDEIIATTWFTALESLFQVAP